MANDKLSEQLRKRLEATEGGQPQEIPILGVVEQTGGNFKIKAGEIREVCEGNNEQVAKDLLRGVRDFPDEKTVVVPRLALQAVLDGGTLERYTETGTDGVPVTKTRLVGGKADSKPATPAPPTKPKDK